MNASSIAGNGLICPRGTDSYSQVLVQGLRIRARGILINDSYLLNDTSPMHIAETSLAQCPQVSSIQFGVGLR